MLWLNANKAIGQMILYYHDRPDLPKYGAYVDVTDGFLVVARGTVKARQYGDESDPYCLQDVPGSSGGGALDNGVSQNVTIAQPVATS